jgi:hypothetical protein
VGENLTHLVAASAEFSEGYCLAAPRLVNFPSPHGYAVGCILSPLRGWSHVVPLAVYDLRRPSYRLARPPAVSPPSIV